MSFSTGWSFPPHFDDQGRDLKLVTGHDNIKQALQLVLLTGLGERVNFPGYGCNLEQFLFERLDRQVLIRIEDTVRDTILKFEPRVKNLSVQINAVDQPSTKLIIQVNYFSEDNQQPQSVQFPLDLQPEEVLLGN